MPGHLRDIALKIWLTSRIVPGLLDRGCELLLAQHQRQV